MAGLLTACLLYTSSWAESYVPDGQNNAFVDIAYRLVVDGVTYFSEIPAGTDASGPDFALAWKDSCLLYTSRCV